MDRQRDRQTGTCNTYCGPWGEMAEIIDPLCTYRQIQENALVCDNL